MQNTGIETITLKYVNLPVITVSSRALFMRSIAFSLVGAHTISYNKIAKFALLIRSVPSLKLQFVK